jgi:hypothetical protein
LDRDYFTIPVDDILNIEAAMTGLSGEILWDNLDGQEQLAPRLQ